MNSIERLQAQRRLTRDYLSEGEASDIDKMLIIENQIAIMDALVAIWLDCKSR